MEIIPQKLLPVTMLPIFPAIPTNLIPQTKKVAGNILEGGGVPNLVIFFFPYMGSQHPSPDVKSLCNFETQIWLEIITSRDGKSACFKGSRMSCREIIFGISHDRELDFGPIRVRFGSVWVRFGSVSGCWVGSGWRRREGLL